VVEAERQRAPVLLVDVGNALFKHPTGGSSPDVRARAELLLAQMDALGTEAMAVGQRDLSLGLDFLRRSTAGLKRLRLLSVNLVGADGKPAFAPSALVSVGGLKVGLLGVSPEGAPPGERGLKGLPAVPAALAEAKRLREKEKADVVVALAALPAAEAFRLAREAGTSVDFVLQSHEARGPAMGERTEHATLVSGGERGRQLGRLELTVDGASGPFVDLSEAQRAREGLKLIDANIGRVKERLAQTQDPRSRRALEEALATFQGRKKQLELTARQGASGSGRTQALTYVNLGADIPSDRTLQAAVERVEPPGSAHEH
jgi:2',3'-cyclic-nucleotide 2'-phosphodiesterase (5'-nucleotidase family)